MMNVVVYSAAASIMMLVAVTPVVDAFTSLPRGLLHSTRESFALQALPAQKPLNEYATPTRIPPYFGYDVIDTEKKENQIEVTGYVIGATIDDLFKLASDFTEKSAFWGKLFVEFKQPSYRAQGPNGVGDVRDFVWSGGRQYVEQLSYSDPEAHVFVYTLHASSSFSVKPLNSVITYCSFVDEPENNRVKVTWRALIQTASALIPSSIVKNAQKKAYSSIITEMQSFYPEK